MRVPAHRGPQGAGLDSLLEELRTRTGGLWRKRVQVCARLRAPALGTHSCGETGAPWGKHVLSRDSREARPRPSSLSGLPCLVLGRPLPCPAPGQHAVFCLGDCCAGHAPACDCAHGLHVGLGVRLPGSGAGIRTSFLSKAERPTYRQTTFIDLSVNGPTFGLSPRWLSRATLP